VTATRPRPPRPPRAQGRLALFSDRFPELSETFVTGEVRELRRQGVDVSVYARPPHVPDPHWLGDVPVHPLEVGLERRPARLLPLVRVAVRRPAAVMRDLVQGRRWRRRERVTPLRRLAPALERLQREGTSHIHVHFAAEAALDALRAHRLTGIPFSVTAHAYELFKVPANLKDKVDEAAFFTVPCAYNTRELERQGLPVDRVHVRMLGTDPRTFKRRAPYPADGVTLAVGRLVEKKGFHVLIDAAARRDIGPLVIVGEGPWRERLEAAIARSGLHDRVTLAGTASPTQIRSWMERAGLMVVPSVVAADGDRDALPVVIWEALAMELPVVGTAVAGLPEVIRPPWGRIVAPDDPDALGDAIADWRAAPAEGRAADGRQGREWLEANHRQDLAVRRLMELIEGS
jgi:glycosyltransferase involved in cell wall biosynthesis